MADATKLDHVATLPDEVLKEVFNRLPSLGDKLRLESVSHRFQRCLIELLNTQPIPLVFDGQEMQLNGYHVPLEEQLSGAVQTLAKKAKFNCIDLRYAATTEELNSILTALVGPDSGCLPKVTMLQVLSKISETLLAEVISKCPKLSDVRLDWLNEDVKKLGLALREKTLDHLNISLHGHRQQQQLIDLYQSLKPKTLKKIKLGIDRMTLDVDVLVRELYGGAWAALEEIEFEWGDMELDMAKLFSSLSDLPELRKCCIALKHIRPNYQLSAVLMSLFANQQIEIAVSYNDLGLAERACHYQVVYPDLQVGFGAMDNKDLLLKLGKVSFQRRTLSIMPCYNYVDCDNCGIFYPMVLSSLIKNADRHIIDFNNFNRGIPLEDCRLDRCRIDTIAAHLNQVTADREKRGSLKLWKVLDVVKNEAQNQATVRFQTDFEEGPPHDEYQFTLAIGHCLTNGCFGCINVG